MSSNVYESYWLRQAVLNQRWKMPMQSSVHEIVGSGHVAPADSDNEYHCRSSLGLWLWDPINEATTDRCLSVRRRWHEMRLRSCDVNRCVPDCSCQSLSCGAHAWQGVRHLWRPMTSPRDVALRCWLEQNPVGQSAPPSSSDELSWLVRVSTVQITWVDLSRIGRQKKQPVILWWAELTCKIVHSPVDLSRIGRYLSR